VRLQTEEIDATEAPGYRAMLPVVIVVDEDPAVHRVLGQELRREGYDVQSVSSPQAALRMDPEGLSLVILDIRGAPEAAPAAIACLREHHTTLPIIALSGARDALEWADRLEVDAFLSKPFDLHRLLLMVEVLLQRQHLALPAF
jgi:DNA-binding response OmpR family regulator